LGLKATKNLACFSLGYTVYIYHIQVLVQSTTSRLLTVSLADVDETLLADCSQTFPAQMVNLHMWLQSKSVSSWKKWNAQCLCALWGEGNCPL